MDTRMKVGTVVRVGLAYSTETRARTLADEFSDVVGTVVGRRWLSNDRPSTDRDLLICRGVYLGADVPDAADYDFAVNIERCEVVS